MSDNDKTGERGSCEVDDWDIETELRTDLFELRLQLYLHLHGVTKVALSLSRFIDSQSREVGITTIRRVLSTRYFDYEDTASSIADLLANILILMIEENRIGK